MRIVPEGDTHERLVCGDCGYITYDNPKIVVGSVATWESKILMCRRAIDPRKGFWTLPAGYLELNETPTDGARREAAEEACADLAIRDLLAIYTIPRISQVQLIYRAQLKTADIACGEESSDVGLFDWDDIPWDEIAFPSVIWALNHFREAGDAENIVPRTNPVGDFGNMTEG